MRQIVVEEIMENMDNSFYEENKPNFKECKISQIRDRTININNVIRKGMSKYRGKYIGWLDITTFNYPGDYDKPNFNNWQYHTISITEKSYTKFLKESQKENSTNIDNPLYGLEV